MSTVLLLFLWCLTCQAGAREEYWREKYEEQSNCARQKEMLELGPGRCASTGVKHTARPFHIQREDQWVECKTQLATKLSRKCKPGSVGQEGTNTISTD